MRSSLFLAGLVPLVGLASTLVSCSGGPSTIGKDSVPPLSSDRTSTTAETPALPLTTFGAVPPASLVGPQGFRRVTVTVTRPDGTAESFCLWLADTDGERQRGLMQVTDPTLGGLPGILFVFQQDSTGGFWMKNTLLPLSIAFINAEGSLVSSTDMEPCARGESCQTYAPGGPYRYAVEVPKGKLGTVALDVPGSTLVVGEQSCAPP